MRKLIIIKVLFGELNLWLCNYFVTYIPFHFIRNIYYRYVMRFVIGSDTAIHMNAYFDARKGFTIGDNSVINQNCRLDTRGGITIGSNVSISADCIILTADHDVQDLEFCGRKKEVIIEDYAFLGTRCMILPGVKIGKGAVIAAGAILTKDAEPYKIYAGIPARNIGVRETNLSYELNYKRLFH